ncbi:ABCG22 [Symbiodinium natans]|uniref:ABCG22 protein n=1 Tax=Symbiodinium natans TaxID=878477 RepID=A0A812JSA1_9DINO|nr:ABCG22 [Symbiodinium natans]
MCLGTYVFGRLDEKNRRDLPGAKKRSQRARIHQDPSLHLDASLDEFKLQEEDMQIRFMHGVLGSGKTVFGSSVLVHVDNLHEYGLNLLRQGRLPEAEHAFFKAWESRAARLGADHPMVHQSLRECAEARRRRGKAAEAEAILQDHLCHGYHQRHPHRGNATLSTSCLHTATTPKNPRAERGSDFPTPDPGPWRGDETLVRRSFSMSAEIRRSPTATLKLLQTAGS